MSTDKVSVCDICWEESTSLQSAHRGCRKRICGRCLTTWTALSRDQSCPMRCQSAGSVSITVVPRVPLNRFFQSWSEWRTWWWMLSYIRNCPVCVAPTIKDGGCDKIRCTRCHTLWCYVCGKERASYDAHLCKPNSGPNYRKALVLATGSLSGVAMIVALDRLVRWLPKMSLTSASISHWIERIVLDLVVLAFLRGLLVSQN